MIFVAKFIKFDAHVELAAPLHNIVAMPTSDSSLHIMQSISQVTNVTKYKNHDEIMKMMNLIKNSKKRDKKCSTCYYRASFLFSCSSQKFMCSDCSAITLHYHNNIIMGTTPIGPICYITKYKCYIRTKNGLREYYFRNINDLINYVQTFRRYSTYCPSIKCGCADDRRIPNPPCINCAKAVFHCHHLRIYHCWLICHISDDLDVAKLILNIIFAPHN